MNKNILKQNNTKFIKGAILPFNMPNSLYFKEIVFIGRSNVGKSSLINVIIDNNITKTSKMPGRTKEINFFNFNNKAIIVDLPGYGYANNCKLQTKTWHHLIFFYLTNRINIKKIYCLIDLRRGIGKKDIAMLNLLNKLSIYNNIIFTKSDKLSNNSKAYNIIKNINFKNKIYITSSKTLYGINNLKKSIIN